MEMKNIIFSFVLLCVINNTVYSEKLVSDSKMDSLTRDADAFVISQKNAFRVYDNEEAQLTVKLRLQINNKHGEKYNKIVLYENEFREIDDIEAQITNLNGKMLKEMDDDDIIETTVSPGFILYRKNKYKSFHLKHHSYPYILDVKYTIDISSLFYWPGWYPQWDIPVQYSEYKLIREEPIKFNSFSIGEKVAPQKSIEDGDSVSVWILENIPKLIDEDFMPPENKVQQALLFSPIKFVFGKSEGDFTSWDSFAEWYRQLIKDKFILTPEVEQKVLEMTKDIKDPYLIISTLYKYLQNNTRYVAIYLDIGGIEPHSAQSICKNKYGDCKDLTILMITMLKYAGIKAYPALVLTRDKGVVYPDFVASQFNHVIAFVPLKNDTLWLECTADNMDITDKPWTIEDVNTLVIKENSGEIIRTPKTSMSENMWLSTSKIEYQRPGMLFIDSRITISGKQKGFFKGLFTYNKPDEEKIILQKIFGEYVPNLMIDNYSYEKEGDEDINYQIEFNGVYRKSIVHTGKRIFINPNLFNRKTKDNLPDEEDRKFPIHFSYPYQDIDAIYMEIPQGYALESAPEAISIDLPFASYKTEYTLTENRLKYIREFIYKDNDISIKDYPEFCKFLKTVIKNDDAHFIFKK